MDRSEKSALGYAHSEKNISDALGIDMEKLDYQIQGIVKSWATFDNLSKSIITEDLHSKLTPKELAVLGVEYVLKVLGL